MLTSTQILDLAHELERMQADERVEFLDRVGSTWRESPDKPHDISIA